MAIEALVSMPISAPRLPACSSTNLEKLKTVIVAPESLARPWSESSRSTTMSLTMAETSVSSSTPWLVGSVSRVRVTSAMSASSQGEALESAGSIPIIGVLRSNPWMALKGDREAMACPCSGDITDASDSFLPSIRVEAAATRAETASALSSPESIRVCQSSGEEGSQSGARPRIPGQWRGSS